MKVRGPKFHILNGCSDVKPYYLSTWRVKATCLMAKLVEPWRCTKMSRLAKLRTLVVRVFANRIVELGVLLGTRPFGGSTYIAIVYYGPL